MTDGSVDQPVVFDDHSEDKVIGDAKVGVGQQVGDRAGIVRELLQFLWLQKLWWMIPMVLVLLVFGVLIILATATPLGPFIYTLF